MRTNEPHENRRTKIMQNTNVKIAGWNVMIAENGELCLSDGTTITEFPDSRGTHPANWHEMPNSKPHCPYCYAGRHPEEIRAIKAKYQN